MAIVGTARHGIPIARHDPTGKRLTATMNPIVARNFTRASARWRTLSRAM
jgi:hypothetical protein